MASLIALIERRKSRGLSQGDLALAAGVSRQAIGAIESGRVQPGVDVAVAIARTVGGTVEEFFAGPPGGRFRVEFHSRASRAALAIVEGRLTARPLGADPGQPEPAGAIVASLHNGRAELEALADDRRVAATVFLAGCEPALGLLAGHLGTRAAYGLWFAGSNREALADFTAGRVHASALHGASHELERMLHEARRRTMVDVFELATIEEGWIVADGNPLKLRGARDVQRSGVRIASRAPGSAARTLLDTELRRAGISSKDVPGYKSNFARHADVARAIAYGYADIGVAVASVADAFKLSFIPLRAERCVLAVRRSERRHPGVAALVATIRSNEFRRDLGAFGPYDLTRLGESLS